MPVSSETFVFDGFFLNSPMDKLLVIKKWMDKLSIINLHPFCPQVRMMPKHF